MNVEGSADSPPWTRIVQVAGVDVSVTRLRSRAEQFRCDPHGALVTATLKANGWHSYASCGKCAPDALRPVLDAIAAAQSNGHAKAEKPREEPQREEPKTERKQQQRSSAHSSRGNNKGDRDPFTQVPPNNIEAEMSVLGSVLVENELIANISWLGVDAFYRESHREIYKAMLWLRSTGKPIDLVTLSQTLETSGIFESVGGKDYIAELATFEGNQSSIAHYAAIVRDLSIKRDIDMKARRIASLARDGVSLDALNGEMERLLKPLIVPLEQTRPSLLTFAESKRLAEEADARPHIIQDLITTEDIFGVAGKKGFGKSTLLRWMAVAVSEGWDFLGLRTNQTRVWYLDLEPGNQQKRHEKFERLGWNERSQNLIITASPPVAGQPWAFEWLEEKIEKNGFGLVIIDTLFKLCKIESGNDYSSGLYGSAPLEGVVKRTKAAIGISHHAQKNSNPNNPNVSAADLFLGAVSIAGSFGVCLAIRRTRGGSGGSRTTLFMDPPRYTRQVIEGEWLIAEDPMTGRVELGESLKRDWWKRAQEDVMGAARRLGKPFTVTDVLDRVDGYKRPELKRILGYLVDERKLKDLGKEKRRGGAVQYEVINSSEPEDRRQGD
jgi:hypothetical protein